MSPTGVQQPVPDPGASSEALARAAREGSRLAFDRLVERHQAPLLRFLRVRCERLEDAQELAQESFLRAWRNLDHYDPRQSFSAWLFTIAARLTISHLRRAVPRPLQESLSERIVDGQPGPEEQALGRERDENLWCIARERLSPDQRSALWLHYVEGLPTAEVARVLGKLDSSTRVVLHRAREALRRALEAADRNASSADRGVGYSQAAETPGC